MEFYCRARDFACVAITGIQAVAVLENEDSTRCVLEVGIGSVRNIGDVGTGQFGLEGSFGGYDDALQLSDGRGPNIERIALGRSRVFRSVYSSGSGSGGDGG